MWPIIRGMAGRYPGQGKFFRPARASSQMTDLATALEAGR
jgi:hypothetical protein